MDGCTCIKDIKIMERYTYRLWNDMRVLKTAIIEGYIFVLEI